MNERLKQFGQTIFTRMSQLAAQHGAINLGQGFPNFDGPPFVKDAAAAAMARGENQYARMFGIPPLNQAIAARWQHETGAQIDPDTQVTVTSGCQEAIAATMLGLLNPGDEVIILEPCFDTYWPCVVAAGGSVRVVTMRSPDFAIDPDELQRAFGPRTRAILVNTPHNPTGKVFSAAELGMIARLCVRHNVLAIVDEVYEKLVYAGQHLHLAAMEGMADRTVTLSSLGKTFSLTGWKVGWAIASPHLSQGIRNAHQILTFSTATPLQHGAVAAFAAPESFYADLLGAYRRRRDILLAGLESIGLRAMAPDGSYFIIADHTPFGFADDFEFCNHLTTQIRVAAIPGSALHINPHEGRHLVRFAFCKDEQTLLAAIERLKALRPR